MGGIVIVDSVSGGTTDGANKDLSNLTVTGEARFTAKAGVDLDNISSAGVSVITSYATGGGANTDLSNLSVTGQAVIDDKADTDLDNLTVTGEAKFKAPALISGDADNGLTSGTDDKLYIDVNVSGKANTDLDNITSAGTSVITSLITSNITGKANTDLDNLSVTGQAVIDGKANVSLNNLTSAGTSVITSLVASGITGKANVDLDNLSVTGEAKFTAKAGVDLDNISSAGVSVITSYATGGGANTDLSNLSVTGQAVIDGKANTDLDNLSVTGQAVIDGKANRLEIGSLISSSLPILNAVKYVLADGTQYSTTGVYQAFADYLAQVKLTHPQCFVTQAEFDADIASTGQCGRYVLDTVNFRVPKITRFIGATVNLTDIGKAWGESLPNISGYSDKYDDTSGWSPSIDVHGAFYVESLQTSGKVTSDSTSSSYQFGRFGFDASRSSSTYQDGAKVNPERITYPYYIVVSNAGQMTPVEIDINNVLNDVALKMDKTGDNATWSNASKETIVSWCMPDYSAGVDIKSSVVSANGYTCDSSGQCFFKGNSNSTLTIIINGQTAMINSTPTGFALGFAFNVDKGDVIKGNNVNSAQFFPLKGVN